MGKKYYLIFSIVALINTFNAAAQQHSGGRISTGITPSSAGISPISWLIFGAIALIVGYSIYWLFSKNKKPF